MLGTGPKFSFPKTDSETEICVQEVYWGVISETKPVKEWKAQSWSEFNHNELQQRTQLGPLNLFWRDGPLELALLRHWGWRVCVPASASHEMAPTEGPQLWWDTYFQQRSNSIEEISFELSVVNTLSNWGNTCFIPEGDSWVVEMPQNTSGS